MATIVLIICFALLWLSHPPVYGWNKTLLDSYHCVDGLPANDVPLQIWPLSICSSAWTQKWQPWSGPMALILTLICDMRGCALWRNW